MGWAPGGVRHVRPSDAALGRRSSACGRISSAAARPATSAMKRRWAWRRCAWRSIPWTAAPAPTIGHAAVAARQRQLMVPARHAHGGQTGAGARSSPGAPFSPSTGWITSSCTSRPRDSRRACMSCAWNKDDKNETARADACYRELAETFARHGVGVTAPRRTTTTLHMRQMIRNCATPAPPSRRRLTPMASSAPENTGFPRRNDDGA